MINESEHLTKEEILHVTSELFNILTKMLHGIGSYYLYVDCNK